VLPQDAALAPLAFRTDFAASGPEGFGPSKESGLTLFVSLLK